MAIKRGASSGRRKTPSRQVKVLIKIDSTWYLWNGLKGINQKKAQDVAKSLKKDPKVSDIKIVSSALAIRELEYLNG